MSTINPYNNSMNLLDLLSKNNPKSNPFQKSQDSQQPSSLLDTFIFSGKTATKVDVTAMLKINVSTSYTGGGTVKIDCPYPQGAPMTSLPGYQELNGGYKLSRAEPEMSEEEYEQTIKDLAKKDAAAGTFKGYGASYDEYMKLQASYVSVVSPDRNGIIGSAAGSAIPNINAVMAKAYDDSGNQIATYSGNYGWEILGTEDEFARIRNFHDIYGAAWKDARNEYGKSDSGSLVNASA